MYAMHISQNQSIDIRSEVTEFGSTVTAAQSIKEVKMFKE